MINAETRDPAVAWLQGFLHAFAWFNNKTNHVYTFSLDIVPKPLSAQQAIESHIGGELDGILLSPVEDWSGFMREWMGRWLFQYSDVSMDHLTDSRKSFSLFHDHFRKILFDDVIGRLSAMVDASTVWKVEVRTNSWYECFYEDLAFEQPERLLYLHAGVSD